MSTVGPHRPPAPSPRSAPARGIPAAFLTRAPSNAGVTIGGGRFTPPAGTFTSISASSSHTCGVLNTGAVKCWGSDWEGKSTPPAGTFTSVSAGSRHTCGVLDSGAVKCWGDNEYGQSTPPAGTFVGTFTSVSAGSSHTCGVLDSGAVKCWGNNEYGQSTPPAGTFVGTFTSVSAGSSRTCGVLDSGAVKCWGFNFGGQRTPPGGTFTPTAGTFTSVSIGGMHTCGLLNTGAVRCWDIYKGSQITLHAGTFVGTFASVGAGWMHTCGVLDTGAVECWGNNEEGQSTSPAGTFASVSGGWEHNCGVLDTGAVKCWGNNEEGQSTPPGGTFTSVSAGGMHTCGVLKTGAVKCWGLNFFGQSRPPAGIFASVSAGGMHTCGVLKTGAVKCWGNNESGQSTPPGGTFTSVSAGLVHTCGVLKTGAVECWGLNKLPKQLTFEFDVVPQLREITPPAGIFGTFASVSAGGMHTCGVLKTGAVKCWGIEDAIIKDGRKSRTPWLGVATPPGDTFTSVSTGLAHACGVLKTGAVKCWGNNEKGQSTPPGGRSFSSADLKLANEQRNEEGIAQDRNALIAFFDATNDPDRGNGWHKDKRTNWKNENVPLGEWHGVDTDENGRVTKLELPNSGLCGTIPAELGDLTELTHLDLSNNWCDRGRLKRDPPGLTGGIPGELGNLANLEVLNLSQNGLTGNIPDALGNLANLQILNLSENRQKTGLVSWTGGLEGTVPDNLSELDNLRELRLNNNLLTGDIRKVLHGFEGHDFKVRSLEVDVDDNLWHEYQDTDWSLLKGEMIVEDIKKGSRTCLGEDNEKVCDIAQIGLKFLKFTSSGGGKWLFRAGGVSSVAYTVLASDVGQQLVTRVVIKGEPLERVVGDIVGDLVNNYAIRPVLATGCAIAGRNDEDCVHELMPEVRMKNLSENTKWYLDNCVINVKEENREKCGLQEKPPG